MAFSSQMQNKVGFCDKNAGRKTILLKELIIRAIF